MSKQKTRHIKVWLDPKAAETGSKFQYFAHNKHTDNYSWAPSAEQVRLDVARRDNSEFGCKLLGLDSFVTDLIPCI